MTLTADEAKEAMKIAIYGMLSQLEAATLVADQHGARFEFVGKRLTGQPKTVAVAYVFVSEDESRMIAIHRAVSDLFV